ncbi:MAG: hypothetical protein E6Q44_15325, partial [Flavobacteriales bacterium]
MAESNVRTLPTKIQRYVWGKLEHVRRSVWNSQAKNFILLALPYQVNAVLTALIAVGYTKLFQAAQHWNHGLVAQDPKMILLTAPLAFVASWWLVRYFSPMSAGSGIPQLMAAVEVAKDEERNDGSWRFLNVRTLPTKIQRYVWGKLEHVRRS